MVPATQVVGKITGSQGKVLRPTWMVVDMKVNLSKIASMVKAHMFGKMGVSTVVGGLRICWRVLVFIIGKMGSSIVVSG